MLNSTFGVGLAAFLARSAPPRIGYRLAYFVADWIAGQRQWPMVKAVRANQWVVSGGKLAGVELERQVQKTFRNTARSIYDLHRDIQKGERLQRLAEQENILVEILRRPRFAERGLVVVGTHMSNFDFIIQAGAKLGSQGLVLTIPELTGGYQQQFEMRRQAGMELLPASMAAMRECIAYLKQGGLVITGMDRPVENPTHRPRFFGRPSTLPVLHVYLALKAHVPLVVASVMRNDDGTYQILSSEPLEMVECTNRESELCENAEKVCRAAEDFIRMAPEQWSMSFPVWPEALSEVVG